MKKVMCAIFTVFALLSSTTSVFADDSITLLKTCYHQYIKTEIGNGYDRLRADGRIERVQTYMYRCKKCGDYYYADEVLYIYVKP